MAAPPLLVGDLLSSSTAAEGPPSVLAPGRVLLKVHCGSAVRLVAIALVGVHGAAGEDPVAAHEAGLRGAPDEQDLKSRRRPAQEDDGRSLARIGDLARSAELFPRGEIVSVHRA